jgi:(p)ppGpp synthase/HD superfamily hydrolase
LLRTRKIRPILEKTGYSSFDNVLEALGEGALDVKNLLQMFYPHNLEKFFEGQVFKRSISEQEVSRYPTVLKVYSDDYVGLLHRITHAVSSTEADILNIGFHTHWKSNTAITDLTLEVENFVQLSQIFEKLGEIEGVHAVKSGFHVGHVARIAIVIAFLIFFCVSLYFLLVSFL